MFVVPHLDGARTGLRLVVSACLGMSMIGLCVGLLGAADPAPGTESPSDGLILLSTGRDVTVSGEWDGRPKLAKSHANDGNFATIWAGPEHSRRGWVQIDLGGELEVTAALLDEMPYRRIRNYELRAKVDAAWKVVADGTTIGAKKRIAFDAVRAREFRLVILDAIDVPTISEFRLYGPADQKLPPLASELRRMPLEPGSNPYWQEHVNRQRDYDFYAKQAIRYGGMKAGEVPSVIPPYPGLDGGVTHWGNQNEHTWRDNRVNEMDFGSMVGGVFRGGGKAIGRAYALRLDDGYRAVFNLDTLAFELAWRGDRLRWSDVRVGLVNGLGIADDPVVPLVSADRPDKSARYIGLHRRGERVVFEYEIDGKRRFRYAAVRDGKVHELDADSLAAAVGTATAPNWPQRITTRGSLGTGAPYAIDTLTLPYENPWKALMFISGVDFVSPTRIAVCTLHGDVWVVDAKGDDLGELRWKRFAAGLHQTAGLKVVDGVIHVMGRDQLVALRDTDGDDEADFYECVSMAHVLSGGGHDFITGLERDEKGRWYFASGNQGLVRVSPDGKKTDVLANGFRNPNGLGVSPDGSVVLTSVQEGTWTPGSAICDASKGGYFGNGGPRLKEPPGYTMPMLYLPRGVDNSSAGQTFIDSDRWGPVRGRWLHQSYGAARHFLVFREVVDGRSQGAAVPLPGEFLSGAHRARFSPHDGQLYVVGAQGWGSYGVKDGSLQRVRYTGGDYPYPIGYETRENGVLLTFATPRDAAIADADKWFAQQWNYRYSAAYGSSEYTASRPDVEGHDPLAIRSVQRLDGGRRVFVEIPQLRPVNQLHLHFNGERRVELFATIHRLGKPFTDYPGYTRIAKEAPEVKPVPSAAPVTVATCVACHHPTQKVVGPPLTELRMRYAGNPAGIVSQAMNPQKKDPNLPPMPSFKFLGEQKLREIADQILAPVASPGP